MLLQRALLQHDSADSVDRKSTGTEIYDAGGMFIEPEHRQRLLELFDESGEPGTAHKAAACIMGATLSVVPVRNDDEVEAKGAEKVEALHPVGRGPNLVDLINRQSEFSGSQRRGTRHHQTAAPVDEFDHDFRYRRPLQLPDRISWTSGTDEKIIGLAQLPVGPGRLDLGNGFGGFKGCDLERAADPLPEIGGGIFPYHVGVELKTGRRVEKHGLRIRQVGRQQ